MTSNTNNPKPYLQLQVQRAPTQDWGILNRFHDLNVEYAHKNPERLRKEVEAHRDKWICVYPDWKYRIVEVESLYLKPFDPIATSTKATA